MWGGLSWTGILTTEKSVGRVKYNARSRMKCYPPNFCVFSGILSKYDMVYDVGRSYTEWENSARQSPRSTMSPASSRDRESLKTSYKSFLRMPRWSIIVLIIASSWLRLDDWVAFSCGSLMLSPEPHTGWVIKPWYKAPTKIGCAVLKTQTGQCQYTTGLMPKCT